MKTPKKKTFAGKSKVYKIGSKEELLRLANGTLLNPVAINIFKPL